jgi:hypothetical protein
LTLLIVNWTIATPIPAEVDALGTQGVFRVVRVSHAERERRHGVDSA